MGELLRSKGFVWIASTNKIMGAMQQAGNVLRIEGEGLWMSETRDMWEGTPSEALVKRDMTDESGKEYQYADRRQELVFIGIGLNHKAIQKALDDCLLTDEEFALGPEKWEETMGPLDKIALIVEEEEELEDEEAEDDTEDEGEEENEEENIPRKRAKR